MGIFQLFLHVTAFTHFIHRLMPRRRRNSLEYYIHGYGIAHSIQPGPDWPGLKGHTPGVAKGQRNAAEPERLERVRKAKQGILRKNLGR